MRRLLLLALVACHTPATPRAPGLACAPGRIGKVTVTGAPRSAIAPLAVLEGTLDEPERTTRIVALTEALLHREGYPRAKLAVARHTGCGVELAVTAALGPRFRIARIVFATADDLDPAVRRDAFAISLDSGRRIQTVGGDYDAGWLETSVRQLATAYKDRGWTNVEIGEVAVHEDDATGTVELTVPITPHDRFKIGELRAAPDDPVALAALATIGLRSGDWFDARAVELATDRMRRHVGHRVYLRTTPRDDHHVIDVELAVSR
ncbi:MAG TPA: hypothetical protein VFQ53_27390 [Kofleriaceae bacterium]|nr:hypothetical protein [Kofleriaceae bacterium]